MAAPHNAVVHPLVLLSTVDHYNRVAKDTRKRVVGVLLGEVFKGSVDITNSFAVPFDEDERDPTVWYLDHNYLESMAHMYRKVNAREKIVGWYSTGPKIRSNDLAINELFRKYTPNPVLVIIDIRTETTLGLPTEAYVAKYEVAEDQEQQKQTFINISSEIGALEAEEVGVEHLLRDIKDTTASPLSLRIGDRVNGLKLLAGKIQDIERYLEAVCREGSGMPINNKVMFQLQDMLNLLPNLNQVELLKSFAVQTNDSMLASYLGSLVRSVIALHSLINNKLSLRGAEEAAEAAEAEEEAAKEAKRAAAAAATAGTSGAGDDSAKE